MRNLVQVLLWVPGFCAYFLLTGLLASPVLLAVQKAMDRDLFLPCGTHRNGVRQQEVVQRWYATATAGTYVISGHRLLLFENVQLTEELANLLSQLATGALWKEGYLLTHDLFLGTLWPQLPGPLKTLLRGTSQAWLLWTIAQSLARVGTPLATLARDYYRLWGASQFQGLVPIMVQDAELSFQLFLQARFPESLTEPASVIIDKVPAMPDLPALVRRYDHLNPWNRLLAEMGKSGISRLELSGDRDGVITIRFTDPGQRCSEQTVKTLANREYHPSPWLLEMIRNRVDRSELHLYTSLLSQDVLDIVVRMLECRRAAKEQPEREGVCRWGIVEDSEGGMVFQSPYSLAPLPVWEDRNYPAGRPLSLSGCTYSKQPLCWENTLILGDTSTLYPWPSMTLYSRFSGFKERNNWLLMGQEPQIWYMGSFFQMRVPELLTRFLLESIHSLGQVAINRLVTSLHHRWWGNGYVPAKPEPLPDSKESPEGEDHPLTDNYDCPACKTKRCRYTLCYSCLSRYEAEPMVDLGCSRAAGEKHTICTSCFTRLIQETRLKPCDLCGHYHVNTILESSYHLDPDEHRQDKKSAPRCPVCRTLFDSRRGNIATYLGKECGALWQYIKWLFSDSLGGDSPSRNRNGAAVENSN